MAPVLPVLVPEPVSVPAGEGKSGDARAVRDIESAMFQQVGLLLRPSGRSVLIAAKMANGLSGRACKTGYRGTAVCVLDGDLLPKL